MILKHNSIPTVSESTMLKLLYHLLWDPCSPLTGQCKHRLDFMSDCSCSIKIVLPVSFFWKTQYSDAVSLVYCHDHTIPFKDTYIGEEDPGIPQILTLLMVSNAPKLAGNTVVKWHKITLFTRPNCWLHRKNYLPLVSDGYRGWGKDEWDINFFPSSDVAMTTHLCSSSSLPFALHLRTASNPLKQDLVLFQLENIFISMFLHMKKK